MKFFKDKETANQQNSASSQHSPHSHEVLRSSLLSQPARAVKRIFYPKATEDLTQSMRAQHYINETNEAAKSTRSNCPPCATPNMHDPQESAEMPQPAQATPHTQDPQESASLSPLLQETPHIHDAQESAKLPRSPRKSKVYSKIDTLPQGYSDAPLTQGCLVMEGGAFRGLYSAGVIDALMLNDINLQCTVGTSAGALYGFCYTSAMLGSARFNLRYRHDSRYVGPRALMKNQGVIGWDFVYGRIFLQTREEREHFYNDSRRFVAVATNVDTGLAEYLEKGDKDHRPCADIIAGICASASMPFVSKPIWVGARQYLDGGCACKIPYQWAIDEGYEKIIVIRTREPEYRKPTPKKTARMARLKYGKLYPEFAEVFANSDYAYNQQCEEIEALEKAGRICVIAPTQKVQVDRMETDVEKLGALYQSGLNDALSMMPRIKEYLGK